MRKIIFFAALFLSLNCFSADWIQINEGSDGESTHIDKESIQNKIIKKNKYVLFWNKVIPEKNNSQNVEQVVSKILMDCRNKSLFYPNQIIYYKSGNHLETNDKDWSKKPKDIIPDSVGERYYLYVCQKDKWNELERNKSEAFQDYIDKFKKSPGHECFDDLKTPISELLKNGKANTLQEAYDQALDMVKPPKCSTQSALPPQNKEVKLSNNSEQCNFSGIKYKCKTD